MIAISKGSEPAILRDHAAQWSIRWMETLALYGDLSLVPLDELADLKRYKHPDILAALSTETHHKCAYCERTSEQVSLEVEHFIPKWVAPRAVFRWLNLLPACSGCNALKADHNVLRERIINPSRQEPSKWFLFEDAVLQASAQAPDPEAAERTIEVLALNRAELLEARGRHLAWLNQLDPNGIELVEAARPQRPFAALSRQVLIHSLA